MTVVIDRAPAHRPVAQDVDRRGRRRDADRRDLLAAERVHERRLPRVELAHDGDQQRAIVGLDGARGRQHQRPQLRRARRQLVRVAEQRDQVAGGRRRGREPLDDEALRRRIGREGSRARSESLSSAALCRKRSSAASAPASSADASGAPPPATSSASAARSRAPSASASRSSSDKTPADSRSRAARRPAPRATRPRPRSSRAAPPAPPPTSDRP